MRTCGGSVTSVIGFYRSAKVSAKASSKSISVWSSSWWNASVAWPWKQSSTLAEKVISLSFRPITNGTIIVRNQPETRVNEATAINNRRLLGLRRQHPAWRLLAARTGPLVIATLKALFDENLNGIGFDTAQQLLSESLQLAHEAGEIESDGDYRLEARREIRLWIKQALILERDEQLIATDALEAAFRFVDGLDNRIMTSTASRLSIVQREIEELELRMNPDPTRRAEQIRRQIDALEVALFAAERGEVEVLDEPAAIEAIREVYTLAMSLRYDFRRVEDSYRAADRQLRESVVAQDSHRGQIVDTLLDGHDALLQTDEGQVFDSFQQQLTRSVELDNMKQQIRSLSTQAAMRKALNREQQTELRWLVMRLVKESAVVIEARARSERDVKGFLRTGLANEHHRVGEVLNELFVQAAAIDWSRQPVRRAPGPLPPVGFGNSSLPLVERLRFKDLEDGLQPVLDLVEQHSSLDDMDDEFWSAFDALDRRALVDQTRRLLDEQGRPMSVAEIATRLPPSHDLEALALWLTLGLEAGLPLNGREQVELSDPDGAATRFTLPRVELSAAALAGIELDL